ncbi:RNA recognition motif domain-containing protein [Thiorhodococcus minor]|uniref:RNA-binding protein n=1 Tax=Thiorhodococcus minor TaxID=57489 RepID=A0A6M0K599_9GAMM|nr:RNA-binding protein [Thiorhodococcus minor]NEV64103.1 RNA-binding protein [Thiorhodococcus minor]
MVSTRSTTKSPTVTIRVSHLPDQTSETEIQQLFAVYGKVHRVRLLPGDPGFRFQRVGYIDFDIEAAASAISGLDGHVLKGAVIRAMQVSEWPTETKPLAEPAAPRSPGGQPREGSGRYVYTVVSVEVTAMPTSTPGEPWLRYVLAGGQTPIVGYHRGTVEEVTAFAEACAEEFNLRNSIGWKARTGRTQYRPAASRKPATTE